MILMCFTRIKQARRSEVNERTVHDDGAAAHGCAHMQTNEHRLTACWESGQTASRKMCWRQTHSNE